jgi:hypothetical protein
MHRELENVLIPEGITYIGDHAFAWNKLAQLEIPNTVTYIGNSAFKWNKLVQLELPNTVTYIGDEAFASQYYGVGNTFTRLTIPGSVTYIGVRAFEYNRSLVGLVLAYGVGHIGDGAFIGCKVMGVMLPSTITYIGGSAFLPTIVNMFDGMPMLAASYAIFVNADQAIEEGVFGKFYTENGKKAGTYTYGGSNWSYKR